MGILDDLGGQGILDFLRQNAVNQQFSSGGAPGDTANYGPAPMPFAPAEQNATQPQLNPQPSPMDSAQWPVGPVGAPSSAMAAMPSLSVAQPAGGSAAVAAPQPAVSPPAAGAAPFSLGGAGASTSAPSAAAQTPGLGDRIMATMRSVGHPGGILQTVANGVTAFQTGQPVNASTATDRALQLKGVAPEVIQATHGNPDLLKTIVTQTFGPQTAENLGSGWIRDPRTGKVTRAYEPDDKFQHITRTDAFGGQATGSFNPSTGETKLEPDNSAANGGGGGFLAPGVKTMDSTLTGKDYLAQFSPEIQASVQNYIDGKSTPTGNPRKGFTQTVKMIAQKYGSDIGTPADDANYSARRTMRNQLSSSAPSSLGGQINIGNTAAGHLADLTQKAVELGNVDTGISPLTELVNGVRGLGTDQAAKMEALQGAAQHYGQEITKFYAGSPGGTAERDRFIKAVNGASSPKELAAVLSTEGDLMRSRLDALGGQIKGVLGEDGAAQYPVLRPDGQAALTKVEANVATLRGGNAAPAVQPAPAASSTPDRSAVEAEMRRRGLLK